MKKAVIEIDSSQLLHALEQLPSDDLKKIKWFLKIINVGQVFRLAF